MSILSELNTSIETILPVETGQFSETPPDEYVVLTPLVETYPVFGDNKPLYDVEEIRISLFSKGNYLEKKRQIISVLFDLDFTITDRRLIGLEPDTGYYHFVIDVAKHQNLKED